MISVYLLLDFYIQFLGKLFGKVGDLHLMNPTSFFTSLFVIREKGSVFSHTFMLSILTSCSVVKIGLF